MNLSIQAVEAKASTYIVLENQTNKNIAMSGWEITGQDSLRPYQFDLDFIWKMGERIVITRPGEDLPQVNRIFETSDDFMGNNTILRLTNSSGTLVNEWSVPQSTDGDTT